MKRVSPPETCFLEREHIARLFQTLPTQGRHALRDRALLLFLYNTGARVREVAETTVACLKLGAQPCVRLHGKGDKWRTCPLARAPRFCRAAPACLPVPDQLAFWNLAMNSTSFSTPSKLIAL
jgi:site-specific recombinase XerD